MVKVEVEGLLWVDAEIEIKTKVLVYGAEELLGLVGVQMTDGYLVHQVLMNRAPFTILFGSRTKSSNGSQLRSWSGTGMKHVVSSESRSVSAFSRSRHKLRGHSRVNSWSRSSDKRIR